MVIKLRDDRGVEPFEEILHYEGGIEAFVRHLDKAKTALIKAPISVRGVREKVEIDLSLQWNDSYHEHMLCFTNNIPQKDGGTHLSAFRAALTRVITNYAETSGMAKKEKKKTWMNWPKSMPCTARWRSLRGDCLSWTSRSGGPSGRVGWMCKIQTTVEFG